MKKWINSEDAQKGFLKRWIKHVYNDKIKLRTWLIFIPSSAFFGGKINPYFCSPTLKFYIAGLHNSCSASCALRNQNLLRPIAKKLTLCFLLSFAFQFISLKEDDMPLLVSGYIKTNDFPPQSWVRSSSESKWYNRIKGDTFGMHF